MAFGNSFNKYYARGTGAFGSAKSLYGNAKELLGIKSKRDETTNISSILKLKAQLNEWEILPTNYFYVEICGAGPKSLDSSGDSLKKIPFLCYRTTLPGLQILSNNVRRYGVGFREKRPFTHIFKDQQLDFICDGKGEIRDFFENWMNQIVSYDDGRTAMNNPNYHRYEVGYKDSYVCDINIVMINRPNQKILSVRLIDAFPIAMGDISLNWQEQNTFMTVPMTFAYTKWEKDMFEIVPLKKEKNKTSLLGKIMKGASAIQSLSTLKKPHSLGDLVNSSSTATNAFTGTFY